jgi:hypothetical protein
MATRRKYKTLGFKDGGAVPPSNITDAQPPETLPTPPPVEEPRPKRLKDYSDRVPPSHDLDAVKRAAEATRLADEYRRSPQTLIDQYVDGMQGLSAHKKAFLKSNPLLLNSEIMPLAGAAWQRALANGIADDSEQMNQHILQAVHQGLQKNANGALAMAPPPMPAMPSYDPQVEAAELPPALPIPPSAYLLPIEKTKRSPPVAAPVSRDVPTTNGKKLSEQTQVTLNADERDIAHKAYGWMRKAEAERGVRDAEIEIGAHESRWPISRARMMTPIRPGKSLPPPADRLLQRPGRAAICRKRSLQFQSVSRIR